MELLCSQLGNSDLDWRDDPDRGDGRSFNDEPMPHTTTWQLWAAGFDKDRRTCPRPLLRALDDPKRFLAAHCLLGLGTLERSVPLEQRPQGILAGDWHGAHIELVPGPVEVIPLPDDVRHFWSWKWPFITEETIKQGVMYRHSAPESWRYNPADLPAIRDAWHDRYDVELFSVSWWVVILAICCLPIVRVPLYVRRAFRRRSERCTHWGYDLRESTIDAPNAEPPGAGFPCRMGVRETSATSSFPSSRCRWRRSSSRGCT